MTFYVSPGIYNNFTTDFGYFNEVGNFKGPATPEQIKIDFNYTRLVNVYFYRIIIEVLRLGIRLL